MLIYFIFVFCFNHLLNLLIYFLFFLIILDIFMNLKMVFKVILILKDKNRGLFRTLIIFVTFLYNNLLCLCIRLVLSQYKVSIIVDRLLLINNTMAFYFKFV
jgi:hypothetical protein